MSNLFAKAVCHVLKEAPTEIDPSAVSDAEALQSTLDPNTNPNDTDFSSDQKMAQDHTMAVSRMHQKMVSEVTAWIHKLDEFSEMLNSTDGNSMQSKLKNALPDTLFDKIRTSETKKISRVSMEVASLSELMKGHLASQDNSSLRGV